MAVACSEPVAVRSDAAPTAPTETVFAVAPRTPDPAGFERPPDDLGLDFVHTSGADGRKLLPETMGSGLALFDHDSDGDLDLFLANGCEWDPAEGAAPVVGRLYEWREGRFHDVTEAAGLLRPEYEIVGQGVCAADYDGDGDLDLFLTALGPNLLLENRDGVFADVTARAGVAGGEWTDDEGVPHGEWSASAAFCDLDGDGWLDLFVCNYLQWSRETDVHFTLTGDVKGYANPRLYRGSSCRLYRNRGDGTFEDVTVPSGIHSDEHKALGVCFADVDRDGRLDVLVANDTQPNCLYLNRGEMRFEDTGREAGVGYGDDGRVRAGMGIDAAYYAGEEELAVAVGNFSQEPISFFRSLGTDRTLFTDDNVITGLGRTSGPNLTFATAFVDANLDGHLDLLAINGHLEPDIGLLTESTTWRQAPRLYLNRGEKGRFLDASEVAGGPFAEPIVGRGLALGDLDGDGDVDAVVSENGGTARVWLNTNPGGRPSLRLRLRGPAPNVHAIGAEVRVSGGPFVQTTWVRTGCSYLSQHETTLTFGIGDATRASAVVRWPDGTESRHDDLEVGRVHELRHPDP